MTDVNEQDMGLVTCVQPLHCTGANEGNLGETIYTTTFELQIFRIYSLHRVSQLLLKKMRNNHTRFMNQTMRPFILCRWMNKNLSLQPSIPCEFVRWEQH